jgi:hypothetical protein
MHLSEEQSQESRPIPALLDTGAKSNFISCEQLYNLGMAKTLVRSDFINVKYGSGD